MTATIKDMELVFADYLLPDQLMEDDLIKFEDVMYTVKTITPAANGYILKLINDFDEEEDLLFPDDYKIAWYAFVE